MLRRHLLLVIKLHDQNILLLRQTSVAELTHHALKLKMSDLSSVHIVWVKFVFML